MSIPRPGVFRVAAVGRGLCPVLFATAQRDSGLDIYSDGGFAPKARSRSPTSDGKRAWVMYVYCIFVCFSHISHNLQRILSSNQYRSLAH